MNVHFKLQAGMRPSAILFILPFGAFAQKTAYILIGDSTTNNGTTLNSGGWGNGFCASLKPGVTCINTAKNGASTTSFYANGYWNASIAFIKSEVAQGKKTYATLQFGHNDQKIAGPEVMGANLIKMVDEIRAEGAEPILLTPLTRRTFGNDGKINNTLTPWAEASEQVAQEKQVHILPLMTKSIAYCEAIGDEACHRLNRSPDDNTHLNENGTVVFGRMVANLMQSSFRGHLPIISNRELTFQIEHGVPSF